MISSRQTYRNSAFGLAALTVIINLCACNGDMSVQTYRVPKSQMTPSSDSTPHAPDMTAGPSSLRWTSPPGWREQPPSTMKQVSYQISGSAGNAEVYVVELAGDAGGLVANVNRWREQIGLPQVSDSAVRSQAKSGTGASGNFQWYEIINPGNPSNAIYAAVLTLPPSTIFVKMVGPAGTLQEQRSAFVTFSGSIRR